MRQIVIVLLISIMATGAPQNQPPKSAAPQNAPVTNEPFKFSSLAQLVEEIVYAKDKSGKPIEGLTAKDFVVTEDGKPQDIKFCYYQKLDEVDGAEPDAATAAAAEAVKPTATE